MAERPVMNQQGWADYLDQFGKRPRVTIEGSDTYHAGLKRRKPLRPEAWPVRKKRTGPFAFTGKDKKWMTLQILENVLAQGHQVPEDVTQAGMIGLGFNCVAEIERLYNVPDIIPHPPADIDAIWIISAPGSVTHEQGVKPGWSSEFPWMDNMEWEVVGNALALAVSVTAKRLEKPVEQVTKKDVQQHGPWLIYNSQPGEVEPIYRILTESPNLQIPLEKVLLYDKFVDNSGRERTLVNTADQAESIRMPEDLQPRRLAICVLAAQWVRLGRILAQVQTLPRQAGVLVVPTFTPARYREVHAIMESQGAVVNWLKGKGALEPIRYHLFSLDN